MAQVDGKGYRLPETIDPEAYRCIKVYVPDDFMYLIAFWGAYKFFTTWLAWERDEEHRGTEAAAVWRIGYEMAREAYNAGGECDEMTTARFRVKPGLPWVTQYSYDSGLTWVDMLIQPNWSGQVVGPSIGNQDDANAVAATIIEHVWIWVVEQINDGIDNGIPQATVVSSIMGQLAPYGSGAVLQDAVNQAFEMLESMTDPERAEWAGDCNHIDFWDELRQWINDHASDWLDNLSDWLTETLDDWSGSLTYALNRAAAALGGGAVWNFTTNMGGGGGGGGFGAACDFSHVFDFAVSEQGWVPIDAFPDPAGTDAVYSPACCWQGVAASSGNVFLAITTIFQQRAITNFKGTVTCDGEFQFTVYFRETAGAGGWNVLAIGGGPPGGSVDLELDFPIAPPTLCAEFMIQIAPVPNAVTDLFNVTVDGIGIDPFS